MRVLSNSQAEVLGSYILDRIVRLSFTCLELEGKAMRYEEAGRIEEAALFYAARNRASDRMMDLHALLREMAP